MRVRVFALLSVLLVAGAGQLLAVTIIECNVPSGNFVDVPWGIVAGPDGNVWFTNRDAHRLGRIDVQCNSFTYFLLPQPNPNFTQAANGITVGVDGKLWIAAENAIGNPNLIVQSTVAGVMSGFEVRGGLFGITSGPDGNLWFPQIANNTIGVMNTAGVLIHQFPIPTPNAYPFGIAVGPDGNLWFTETFGNNIGRITPGGVVTEFGIPTFNSAVHWIARGSDGNMWFTENSGNKIGSITMNGVITEFPIPTPIAHPEQITIGPDLAMWFTESSGNANKIARVTTNGVFTEYLVPTPLAAPYGIAFGPDGNIWFTESGNTKKVGKLIPDAQPPSMSALRHKVTSLRIPTGLADSLLSKLDAADAALQRGNTNAACGQLRAFINEVSAQSGRGRPISAADGADLINTAQDIRSSLNC
ncbi:MAG TPA: hypothetical protein VII32_04060 [Thermoanaerobaculia bacterium]|jgi:streptogramin lyase